MRKKEKIRLLKSTLGNDAGDTVKIEVETEEEIYYYDSFKRWCYELKQMEGILFVREVIP